MNINQILFLIAVLNLGGDLYNIIRFRHQVPRWILPVNLISLLGCGAAHLLWPGDDGLVACGILVFYVVAIRLCARKRAAIRKPPSPATKLLIAINIAAFGAQILYGAVDNPHQMILLGAVYSPLVELGEWWRLVSAQFLHWGFAHLFLNMLGLWFIGPAVEAVVGSMRFIIGYLICGVSGMAIAWAIAVYGPEPRVIVLLGASASVLGLVGVQAAISLKAFRYSGSLVAKAQLSAMTQIIVLQAIFDWMVPEVSSTAHLGGAFVGFVLGMLFVRPQHKRARETSFAENPRILDENRATSPKSFIEL